MFSILPSFTEENFSDNLISLEINIQSNETEIPFRKFSSIYADVKNDSIVGLWGINFFEDSNKHVFIFFKVIVVEDNQWTEKARHKKK